MSLLKAVVRSLREDIEAGLHAPVDAYHEAVYVVNGLREGTVSPIRVAKTAVATLFAAGLLVALLFPVYWVVSWALSGSGATLYSSNGFKLIPSALSLEPFLWVIGDVVVSGYTISVNLIGYTVSLSTPELVLLNNGMEAQSDFQKYLSNSLYVSFFTVIFAMSFIVPAAYALSRREFIFRRKTLYLYVLFTQVGAGLGIAGLVALFALLNQFDLALETWITADILQIGGENPLWHAANVLVKNPTQLTVSDNRFVLALYYAAIAVPFNTWLLKTYMDGIPTSYEEAAYVDGAPTWRIVVEIILPLSKAGLATVFIFTYLTGWMEFIVAQTILSTDHYTLPVGLYALLNSGGYQTPWSQFAAFALLFASPVVIVYLFAQRYIEGGLSFGGMEG
ncbi:sugar ABC transporter permease [Halolamina sp.]|uniref:sugar ABC transporter permease n=1 Tax=Halolamina sp. TaxID=1940283 RepID=UPI00356844EF